MMSQDGGQTWQSLPALPITSASQDHWVTSIAVSPTNPEQVAIGAAYQNYPYASDVPNVYVDAATTAVGSTWRDITGNLPAGGVRSVLYDGQVLLAGTDSGLFQSTGTTGQWSLAGTSFPANVPVMSLALSGSGQIAAGTLGRGVWVYGEPNSSSRPHPKPHPKRHLKKHPKRHKS
jgi:hypothetical protein